MTLFQQPGHTICARWIVGILMALMTTAAHAHAVLVESSVKDRLLPPQTEVVAVARFNAKLETNLTKVLLRNAKGEEQTLETLPGSPRGEVKVKLPALVPGTYLLEYKVLAADGHFTAEVIKFRVTKPH
jgi:hypothetical protein